MKGHVSVVRALLIKGAPVDSRTKVSIKVKYMINYVHIILAYYKL